MYRADTLDIAEVTRRLIEAGEARPVVYTVRGADAEYTFTAPNAKAAAAEMAELFLLAAFEPVAATYADDPDAPSPSAPRYAHDEYGRLVPVDGGR